MRLRYVVAAVAALLLAVALLRLWAVAGLLAVGVHANLRLIRTRWLAGQPPVASEGSRRRLAGELGLAAGLAYLAGRRSRKIPSDPSN